MASNSSRVFLPCDTGIGVYDGQYVLVIPFSGVIDSLHANEKVLLIVSDGLPHFVSITDNYVSMSCSYNGAKIKRVKMSDRASYVVDSSDTMYGFIVKDEMINVEFFEVKSVRELSRIFPLAKAKRSLGSSLRRNSSGSIEKFTQASRDVVDDYAKVKIRRNTITINGLKVEYPDDMAFDVADIIEISSRDDCTLISTIHGKVYGCGSNSHHRLGISNNISKQQHLFEITIISTKIVHICVYDSFSLIITKSDDQYAVYTSGVSMFRTSGAFVKVLSINTSC